LLQIKLQKTAEKINQLRLDHIANKFNPAYMNLPDLIPLQPHIPQKDKNQKGVGTTRVPSIPYGTKSPFLTDYSS
jgi:hypothetical protein